VARGRVKNRRLVEKETGVEGGGPISFVIPRHWKHLADIAEGAANTANHIYQCMSHCATAPLGLRCAEYTWGPECNSMKLVDSERDQQGFSHSNQCMWID